MPTTNRPHADDDPNDVGLGEAIDLSHRPKSSGTVTPPLFEAIASRQFTSWLAEQQISLAFTTYQTGKLFLIGLQPDGRLSVFERNFNRCLGL